MKKAGIPILIVLVLAFTLPSMAATAPDATLYKTKCSSCHGPDGAGTTSVGKAMKIRDLRSDEVQKQTDLELTKLIAGGKGKMPAYGKQLSSAQIEGLIAHIRTLKGTPKK